MNNKDRLKFGGMDHLADGQYLGVLPITEIVRFVGRVVLIPAVEINRALDLMVARVTNKNSK